MSSVRLVFRKRSVSWFWWNPSVDNIRHCFWGSWLFFKAEGPEEAESSRRDFNTEGSLRSKWWSSSHISQCWHTGPYICMVWKFKGMVQKLGCSKGTWWSCILLWTRFLTLDVWQQPKWTHHTLLLNVPYKCLTKAFDRLGIRSGDRNNLLLVSELAEISAVIRFVFASAAARYRLPWPGWAACTSPAVPEVISDHQHFVLSAVTVRWCTVSRGYRHNIFQPGHDCLQHMFCAKTSCVSFSELTWVPAAVQLS